MATQTTSKSTKLVAVPKGKTVFTFDQQYDRIVKVRRIFVPATPVGPCVAPTVDFPPANFVPYMSVGALDPSPITDLNDEIQMGGQVPSSRAPNYYFDVPGGSSVAYQFRIPNVFEHFTDTFIYSGSAFQTFDFSAVGADVTLHFNVTFTHADLPFNSLFGTPGGNESHAVSTLHLKVEVNATVLHTESFSASNSNVFDFRGPIDVPLAAYAGNSSVTIKFIIEGSSVITDCKVTSFDGSNFTVQIAEATWAVNAISITC